jgi:maltose alpha-D-glucosyltransferase/alpha-amylase
LRARLETILPDFLRAQPWFSSAGTIKLVTLKDHFIVQLPGEAAALAFLQVEYVEANAETYVLPLGMAKAGEPRQAQDIAELMLTGGGSLGVLYDVLVNPAFSRVLLDLIRSREHLRSGFSRVESMRTAALRRQLNSEPTATPVISTADQGHVTARFLDRAILKFFRRPGPGLNPELEVGLFLTEKNFPHSPPLVGALEYQDGGGGTMTLAVVKGFVPQAMSAWEFTLEAVSRYYDRVFAAVAQGQTSETPPALGPLKLLQKPSATESSDYVGTYLESARLLGQRTAELHLALASGDGGGEFTMDPVTPHYLRGVFESMRSLAIQNLRLLRRGIKFLPPDLASVAQRVTELEPVILRHYRQLVDQRFEAGRIRIHGDCHLNHILWTGRDFVFLDFEGDAAAPISERRIKRSPLRDVARMVRSFHHAAYAGFDHQVELGVIARDNLPKLEPWMRYWNRAVSRAYVQAYCEKLYASGILPVEEDKLRMLLLAYLLHRVMDELGQKLRTRSDSVRAPLQAIIHLTDEQMPVSVPATIEVKSED